MLIGCLIGAVILRAACWFYNKMAGSPSPPLRPREFGDDYEPPAGLGKGAGPGIQEVPDQGYHPSIEDIRKPEYESFVSPSGVPEPTFGQAFAIVLVAYLINLVISVAINFALAGAAGGPAMVQGPRLGGGIPSTSLLSSLILLPISVLVQGGIISAMLPTSFGKGLLVALICVAIGIVIALILGAVIFAVIFALHTLR